MIGGNRKNYRKITQIQCVGDKKPLDFDLHNIQQEALNLLIKLFQNLNDSTITYRKKSKVVEATINENWMIRIRKTKMIIPDRWRHVISKVRYHTYISVFLIPDMGNDELLLFTIGAEGDQYKKYYISLPDYMSNKCLIGDNFTRESECQKHWWGPKGSSKEDFLIKNEVGKQVKNKIIFILLLIQQGKVYVQPRRRGEIATSDLSEDEDEDKDKDSRHFFFIDWILALDMESFLEENYAKKKAKNKD